MFKELCRRLDPLHTEVNLLHMDVKEIKKQQEQILDLLNITCVRK